MKKYQRIHTILLIIALFLTFSAMSPSFGSIRGFASEEEYITVYAPDGRSKQVPEENVAAEVRVGWYRYPVIHMYAPDGRKKVVAASKVEAEEAVGWYRYPVLTMYAPDGRSKTVAEDRAEAEEAVGWYRYPVVTLYAPDGRRKVVDKNKAAAEIAVGWYDHPVRNSEKLSDDTDTVSVLFTRKDHSLSNEVGLINCYYDLASIPESFPNADKINNAIQKDYERFQKTIKEANLPKYLTSEYTYYGPYGDYYSGRISYCRGGILCLAYLWEWHMGGTYNNGHYGLTFDLKTGKQLGIKDLFSMPEDELLAKIRYEIINYVDVLEMSFGVENTRKKVNSYKLESLDFYLDGDGQLVICIPEYELTAGACDSLAIRCGVFVKSVV